MSRAIAGVLILLLWLAQMAHLYLGVTVWPGALLAWLAALILWPGLDAAARQQCGWLYGAALVMLVVAWFHGIRPTAAQLFLPNLDMVTLFAGISCLNLATGDLSRREDAPWGGWKGVLSTLAGVNLLGGVINMSVLLVVGDRLAKHGRLERRQVIMLSRIYCAAAFWSPFFVATAVAFSYAPGMVFARTWPFGLLATLAVMLITLFEVWRLGVKDFEGYPLRLSTLLLPGLLALTVLAGHALAPSASIIGLITLLAPPIALLLMPAANRAQALRRQVTHRFAAMGSQIVLFLGAGLLAAGINGLTQIWSPAPLLACFDHFGAFEATLTVAIILVISYLGVHPIITISSLAPLVWHLHPEPSLLGLTWLIGWGLSTGASPLSGANLALLACYRVRARDLFSWNLLYAVLMMPVCAGLFWLYRSYFGG